MRIPAAPTCSRGGWVSKVEEKASASKGMVEALGGRASCIMRHSSLQAVGGRGCGRYEGGYERGTTEGRAGQVFIAHGRHARLKPFPPKTVRGLLTCFFRAQAQAQLAGCSCLWQGSSPPVRLLACGLR